MKSYYEKSKKEFFYLLIRYGQILIISPVLFVYLAPFLIIMIIIQDSVSSELSTMILQFLFLGREEVTEKDLLGIYFVYAFIASIIVEIINKIWKIKLRVALKSRFIISIAYLLISYFLAYLMFIFFDKNTDIVGASIVFPVLLVVSIFLSSIAIISLYVLGELRKKIK